MENGKQSAFPITEDAISYGNREFEMSGLTKREYFAGLAMQGILASDWGKKETERGKADLIVSQITKGSIVIADALLKALEEQ